MAYTPTLLVTSGTGVDTLKAASDKININLNAISTEIETVRISVVEWTNSVISKESSTPPVSPSEGDRYIVKATGSGDWASHDTEIAEYDGEDWVFTEPVTGTATVVDDEVIIYVFNGTSWVASEGAPHELSHLSGGTDEIDGDKLDIDYTAINFTPTTESGITTSATQLTSFIKGLDIFAGTKAAASGLASLDASSKVVQDPANATATPTASKIPIADGSAKLDGWITTPILATEKAAASGVASLDASSKVVQAPANHNLVDTTGHPVSGLTSGHVLRASGETAYGFSALTTVDIADSTDKRYCTDAQKTVIGNTSGTNSGNETVTTVGTLVNGATAKDTPIDADMLPLMDSAASNVIKKLSWSYIKTTLKTYFDSLYTLANLGGVPTSRTVAGHGLSTDVTISASDVGLGNVTNAAQLTTTQLGAASGVASLDVSSKVVQDPANATSTPTASKIPIADGSGKLAAGWGGAASTLATLNSSSLVVENPANASTESAVGKIPIADADGTVDNFVTPEYIDINTDLLELEYIPDGYDRTITISSSAINQIASHLAGISEKLAELESRIAAVE